MTPQDAIKKIKAQKSKKFDETIDLIISVQLSKNGESALRTDLNLPNQFGTEKKVLVLCDKSETQDAKGADYIGLEEYVEKIKNGWKEFDVVIATPSVMPKIAVLGKFLGASGLMPNPKNGTITKELDKAIKEFKTGKLNIKANKVGQLQISIGKRSMEDSKITENVTHTLKHITESVIKTANTPLKSIFIKSSMGPSYRLM